MTPAGRRALAAVVALAVCLLALWQLERVRAGVARSESAVGTTPVTFWALPGASGPLVVVAHGFAGSRQMMQGHALSLARAGYRVFVFDFEGHGRNPVPMTGDVTSVEGTTERLVQQTLRVIEAGLARTGASPPVALLGHSMATDILIRAALRDDRIGPLVAISAFSQAITPTMPADLLLISGGWEGALRGYARDALHLVDPLAGEGRTAVAEGVRRRAAVAPGVEHVGVLFSATAMREAVAWIDGYFGRESAAGVAAAGPWLAALLAGILALAWPLSRLLPARPVVAVALSTRQFAAAILLPALAAPLLAVWLDPGLLPVLVADYLMLHLLIFGLLQLGLHAWFGGRHGHFSVTGALALAVWGIGVWGLALDRYGANFVPTAGRLKVIAVLALGCLPFMIGDALITMGGRAAPWRRLAARAALLASLGLAVALDFERLFFLVIIAPVIVLFFLVFGLMGRWIAQRSGTLAAGAGLGLVLAWSLGVSFPLFEAGG